MKKNLRLGPFTVTLIVYSAISCSCIVKASSTPSVSVDPVEVKNLKPDQNFTVSIIVRGIVINETVGYKCYGLYGWSINLTFNPAVLSVEDVIEGPFLKNIQETISLPTIKNNEIGYVFAGAMFRPPFPERGAAGDGILANITFNVVGLGTTNMHFQSSKLNTYIEGNNVPIAHTTNDGTFMNVAPPILSTELIVIIVAVVVIGGSVGLFFYKRRRASTETLTNSHR